MVNSFKTPETVRHDAHEIDCLEFQKIAFTLHIPLVSHCVNCDRNTR